MGSFLHQEVEEIAAHSILFGWAEQLAQVAYPGGYSGSTLGGDVY